MLQQVVTFAGENVEIYSIMDSETGELWFLVDPFANILGYSSVSTAVSYILSENNKKDFDSFTVNNESQLTENQNIEKCSKFINRAGLFELINHSHMPYARKFRMWLCNELLPSLNTPFDDCSQWIAKNANFIQQVWAKHTPCVYVVTTALLLTDDVYRIGWTNCLEKRLEFLNNTSPSDFYTVVAYETKYASKVERALQKYYRRHRVRRDFFRFKNCNIKRILAVMQKYERIEEKNSAVPEPVDIQETTTATKLDGETIEERNSAGTSADDTHAAAKLDKDDIFETIETFLVAKIFSGERNINEMLHKRSIKRFFQ